jgi:hypothetical protein
LAITPPTVTNCVPGSPVKTSFIWGATAAMLVNFARRLSGPLLS